MYTTVYDHSVDLTPLITIDGNVDTSIGGTYSVRYNVEDLQSHF